MILSAVLLLACNRGETSHQSLAAIYTATPTEAPTLAHVGALPPQSVSTLTPTPEPTPVPTPTPVPPTPRPAAPAPTPRVEAESNGVPWYVPVRWHEAYRACLDDPQRYDFWSFLWERSRQAGYPNGWDYGEATRLIGSEGGNDLCQFNTSGSGACGPPQLLTCPGLDLETQKAGMWAKYVDGGYDFWRHWWQWH